MLPCRQGFHVQHASYRDGIYVLGLVAKWVEDMGGVKAMQERAEKRSSMLYDYLDSQDFYKTVAAKDSRSHMNVTFRTGNDELDAKFAKESMAAGMSNLKGHRSVGGMRASIYNAMPIEGVRTHRLHERNSQKKTSNNN